MRRFERPSDNADDRITHVCIRVTLTTSLGSDTFFGLRVGPVDRQRGTTGLEQARFDHRRRGEGLDSKLDVDITTTGTYPIVVSEVEETRGTYVVSVTAN